MYFMTLFVLIELLYKQYIEEFIDYNTYLDPVINVGGGKGGLRIMHVYKKCQTKQKHTKCRFL